MRRYPISLFAVAVVLFGLAAHSAAPSVDPDAPPRPPVAAKKPYTVTSPHGNRVDEYYWLRDDTRRDARVLGYLEAENAYADAALAHLRPLHERVYREIVARLQPDDTTVPYRKGGWWYYTRYATGQDYPVHARRKGDMGAPEQVLLDVPQLASGRDYYAVSAMAVSPNGRLLAYAEDTVGRRQYTLRFKDLANGVLLPDAIPNAEAAVAWARDDRTVYYIEKDPVTLLGNRVRRHVLGTDPAKDVLVYEERDPSFYMEIATTRDDRYVVIQLHSTVATEMRYADAADPVASFKVLLPRERDHEYQAEHLDGRWIIRTNWQAPNFRLMEARVGEEGDRSRWRELLPHRADGFIQAYVPFRDFLAVEERSGGLRRIRVRPWSGGEDSFIASEDPSYAFSLVDNHEVDATRVRYTYDSLTTPLTTYEYEPATRERHLLKRQPVLGGFDPANYVSEFVWAPARDGTRIPVSLVYRKGYRRDGTAPLFQYGYGSYGVSSDPFLNVRMLSLIDRGFVYAIAHVRGGQELGRAWYDAGRLLHKQNTFDDFVDVTRFLVRERYADPKRVFAYGRSAGGLLMGAIANQAPRDYRGIVTEVPFVDVVTTMLDETIPLTTNEFDEWGNPKQKAYYDYQLRYSPYDNVAAQDYPAMMVTTGLWDSQVQYFEPAKWVARLRARKTDSNPLLFRTTMAAGHGGRSGRFQRHHEFAEVLVFVIDQAGLRE
jgi:oligopeptidase B